MIRFVKYHLPVVLYGAVVLGISSLPNLRTPEIKMLATDKLVHFAEYALFAWLAYRSASNLVGINRNKLAGLLSFCFLALFATFDEYLQSFVPGRFAEVSDGLADLAGGSAVLILLWLRDRSRNH